MDEERKRKTQESIRLQSLSLSTSRRVSCSLDPSVSLSVGSLCLFFRRPLLSLQINSKRRIFACPLIDARRKKKKDCGGGHRLKDRQRYVSLLVFGKPVCQSSNQPGRRLTVSWTGHVINLFPTPKQKETDVGNRLMEWESVVLCVWRLSVSFCVPPDKENVFLSLVLSLTRPTVKKKIQPG